MQNQNQHQQVNPDQYTAAATQKAVLKRSILHPVTALSAITAAVAGAKILVLGGGMMAWGLFAGGLGLAFTSWLINYFGRRQKLTEQHLHKLNQAFVQQRDQSLRELRQGLSRLGKIKGAYRFSSQGQKQFDLAKKRLASFEKVLGTKFQTTEITYGRYASTADNLFSAILDNLQKIITSLQSISGIDPDHIERRLRQLDGQKQTSEADEKEVQTLRQRVKLRDEKMAHVNHLLTLNEEALTAFDVTTTSLAQTDVGTSSQADIETAMSQLKDLAERAKAFAKD